MSYSRKGVKFFFLIFGGLIPALLKRCCRIAIIWHAKLAPRRRKCFIANPCFIYESRHKNGNPVVNLKNDNFSARAWECEYEQPFLDDEKDTITLPSSLENAI